MVIVLLPRVIKYVNVSHITMCLYAQDDASFGLNGAKKHEFMILCGIIVKPIIPNPFPQRENGKKSWA